MLLLRRPLFRLGLTANEATVSGRRQPLAYVQILNASLAAFYKLATALTAAGYQNPPGVVPGYAVIQNNVASSSVRWRDDGTAATSAIGMVLNTGELDYSGDIYTIGFISASGSPILDITIYA